MVESIKGTLPTEKNIVLHFDTEMSDYHLSKAVNRVCRLVGEEAPINYNAYGLRKYSPAERLKLIEYAIYHTPNIGLVAIDGLRDLLTNGINDETEATEIISKLMKWTAELNIHIILVLHQNKGDLNARGHIGTEAVNKAETVISVTKSGNETISIVEAEFTRDISFEPFAFTIEDDGLPAICDMPTSNKNKRPQNEPDLIPDETHFFVLSAIFKKQPNQQYKEFQNNIIVTFLEYDHRFGESKSRTFITYYQNKGWIDKKAEGKKTIYQYKRAIF